MKKLLSGWEAYHSSDGIWILYPYIGENILEYIKMPCRTAAEKESVVRQLIREIDTCHKEYKLHFGTSPESVVVNDLGFVVLAGFSSSILLQYAPGPEDDENEEINNMDEGDGEDEDMKDGEYEAMEDGEDEDTEDDGDEAMEDGEDEDMEDEENEMDSYFASLRPSAWKLMHEDWVGCITIINAIIQGCANDPSLYRALSEVRDKIEELLRDAKDSYPKVSASFLSELELFKDNIDDRNMGIPSEEFPFRYDFYIFGSEDGKDFSIKQTLLKGYDRKHMISENPINPM